MIDVEHLSKRYGDTLAVDDLSFQIRPGLVTGFLGPNGAGKSTTMRLIVGLDKPSTGSVTVNGRRDRDLEAPLREVGTMLEARAHRLPILWAKIVVYGAVTFVSMLVAAFVSFFCVQAIVTRHGQDVTLAAPHALRAVIGTALFLTVMGVLAIGLGALVRNTAGGIAAFVGLLFVLPGVTALLPSSIGDTISPYLPLSAAFTVATSTFEDTHHLGTWTGFAVFCGYAAVFVAAAAVSLVRRDA